MMALSEIKDAHKLSNENSADSLMQKSLALVENMLDL
jgi:hypothetical protein